MQENHAADWPTEHFPRFLPVGWRLLEQTETAATYRSFDGMTVVMSGRVESDGKRWLRVSVSFRGRMPTWRELQEVKDRFVGRDRYALQIYPPTDPYAGGQYGNGLPNAVDLWTCMDGHPLPELGGRR